MNQFGEFGDRTTADWTSYYKSLGYTENQCNTLGKISFGNGDGVNCTNDNINASSLVDAFENSTDCLEGKLFEDSFTEFSQSDVYIKYLKTMPADEIYKIWLTEPRALVEKKIQEWILKSSMNKKEDIFGFR